MFVAAPAGKDKEKEAMVKAMVAAGEDVVYITSRVRLNGTLSCSGLLAKGPVGEQAGLNKYWLGACV